MEHTGNSSTTDFILNFKGINLFIHPFSLCSISNDIFFPAIDWLKPRAAFYDILTVVQNQDWYSI